MQTLVQAYQRARQAKLPPERDFVFLSLAYLRYGEIQNCCQQSTPESCILPLRGGGLHSKPEGSSNAMAAFLQVLKPNNPRYHSTRCLHNVAAMTVGDYTNNIPKENRVFNERVSYLGTFPRFSNIAQKGGLASHSFAGGAVVDDLNGDEYLDIMVCVDLTLFFRTFRKV